jgi:hypothetical protein
VTSWVEDWYAKHYRDIGFERSGLFELVRDRFGDVPVLYPASSVHIAPSFHFQNVVYLDIADTTARFFANHEDVVRLVRASKTYKQQPHITYVHGDYTAALPFNKRQFGLVISIYGGKVLEHVRPYLSRNGLVLTCDTFSDAHLGPTSGFEPVAFIASNKSEYRWSPPEARPRGNSSNTGLVDSASGPVFRDYQRYTVLRLRSN